MRKSIRSLKKTVKRFGNIFGGRRASQRTKMPRTRNPQLEQFEDRLLLSISPSITGADMVDEGTPYQLELSSSGDAVARWDIDWGDGTTTTGTIADWGDDIRLNDNGTWTAYHVFTDNITASVTATAFEDIDAEKASPLVATSVINVADRDPVLTLKSSEPMRDGKTFAVILASDDLGNDTIDRWTIDWGDGQVSTGVMPDLQLAKSTGSNSDWGNGIVQIAQNRWVVSHTYENAGSYNVTANASDENGAYAAFKVAGDIDRDFGNRGTATAEFGDDLDALCHELFVDEDGSIVMVGSVDDGANRDYAIARFNKNGMSDTTFYGDGTVIIDGDSFSDGGSVNIAGLEIVAGGDGANTLNDTSLITPAMFDAIRQIDGMSAEAGMINTSIASADTVEKTFYGPLLPTDNLSVTTDNGTLRVNTSLTDENVFAVTRFCSESGGLTINIEQDTSSSSLFTVLTESSESESLLGAEPVTMCMMMSGSTTSELYLSGGNSVNEGSDYNLTIEVSPAIDEEVDELLIEWGDGEVSIGTPPEEGNNWGNDIIDNGDGTWTATHVYKDDGNYAIEVTASMVNSTTGVSTGQVWEYHSPIPGDANRDGRVDDIDAMCVSANWGITSGATWEMGDFDYDFDVDDDDVAILSAHWLDNIKYGDGRFIVNNVVPTLSLSGMYPGGDVGDSAVYTLNVESFDPGADTITEWEINWGDTYWYINETFTKQLDGTWVSDGNGTMTQVEGSDGKWTVTHSYPPIENMAQYTITATPTDEDGKHTNAQNSSQDHSHILVSTPDGDNDSDFSPGNLSLREALFLSTTYLSGVNHITFDPDLFTGGAVTIPLNDNGQLEVSDDVIISGPGADTLTIAGNSINPSRVFKINSGVEALLSGMEITGGYATGADNDGGGIYNAGTLTLNAVTVTDNEADVFGGGIYGYSGTVSLENGTIVSDNHSKYSTGGGIFAASNVNEVNVTNSTISYNTAATYGGGICGFNTEINIIYSFVLGNESSTTSFGGGGIYADNTNINVIGSTISGNKSKTGGGIAGITGSTILIDESSTISDNESTNHGGGIRLYSGSLTVEDGSTISGNESTGGSGGGIYGNSSTEITVTNSTVAGNTANANGGGIYGATGATINLTNSSMVGNSATNGGGIYGYDTAGIELTNATIAGNAANDTSGVGGGIYYDDVNGSLEAANSIISQNTASSYPDIYGSSPAGTNLIGGDPGFISNPSGGIDGWGVGTDDYGNLRLKPGSAASDVGNNNAALEILSDLDGNPRIFELEENGIIDYGAYEYQEKIVVTTLDDDNSNDPYNQYISLREALDIAKNWNSSPDTITFQDGLEGTIALAYGQLIVDSDVTIEGPGADKLIIDAGGNSRVFYVGNGESAVTAELSGITITGGSVSGVLAGGGIFVDGYSDVTVNHSQVLGCATCYEGGGIYADSSSTLNVNNTTIAENAGGWGGGIAAHGMLAITNSVIMDNESSTDSGGIGIAYSLSTLINSVISGNSADEDGGGIFLHDAGLTVINSTIVGNSADDDGGGVYCYGTSTLTVNNSIVSLNEAIDNDDNISGLLSGSSGNNKIDVLSDDIDFIRDPGTNGPDDNGILRLRPDSDAIDAGSNVSAPAGFDLDGNPRIYELENGTVDIGAYEYQGTIFVTTLEDESTDNEYTSLREALEIAAQCTNSQDKISFQDGLEGVITLNGNELEIDSDVIIEGPGSDKLVIDADWQSRVFNIDANVTASLSGMTITGGYVQDNDPNDYTDDNGAGILNAGTLTLKNAIITENYAENYGGGIYGSTDSTLTVGNNSIVSLNTADSSGGGIASSGTVNVFDSTVENNTSMGGGGGVYTPWSSCNVTIHNSVLTGNTTGYTGGAILSGGTLEINNTIISDNHSELNGGGLFLSANATITNSTIDSNTAPNYGGGIYANYSTSNVSISESNVSGNYGSVYGGGIYIGRGILAFENSTLSENEAIGRGGGLYSGVSDIFLANSTITGNQAANVYGGGLYFNSGSNEIVNSVIADNIANLSGGGIYKTPGVEVDLINTTIAGNRASDTAGGLGGQTGTGYYNIYNSIVSLNDTESDTYNNIHSNYTDSHSLIDSSDPGFISDPSEWGDPDNEYGNLRLRKDASSPAINAGDSSFVSGSEDLDSNAREVGTSVDIGAYEYQEKIVVTTLDDDDSNDPYNQYISLREALAIASDWGDDEDTVVFHKSLRSNIDTLGSPGDKELTLSGPREINEGASYELLIAVSGLGAGDTIDSITIDWHDGSEPTNSSSPNGDYQSNWGNGIMRIGPNTWTATHVYTDENQCMAEVTAIANIGSVQTTLSAYYPGIPGDANSDGQVDSVDYEILSSNWQIQEEAAWEDGDFSGDGTIDNDDFVLFANNWQGQSGVIVRDVLPAGITLSNNTALEASSDEETIGTLTVNDPGSLDTYDYELLTHTDIFSIVDGVLKKLSGVTLDYENTPSYDVQVKATSTFSTEISVVETFSILVTDKPEVSGTVFEDANRNGINDNETSLAGWQVNLLNSDGSNAGSTTTDGDGYYQFEDVLTNTYYLQIAPPNNYGGYDQTYPANSASHMVIVNECDLPNYDFGVNKNETSQYIFSIAENDLAGASVGSPLFADKDGLAGWTYEITAGNESGAFRLSSTDPDQLELADNTTLSWNPNDPGSYNRFELTVTATKDGTDHVDGSTVVIYIEAGVDRFGDSDVVDAIRQTVGLSTNEVLLYEHVSGLESLVIDSNVVDSLEGLEYATNLRSLRVAPASFSETPDALAGNDPLEPIASLANLEHLTLQRAGLDSTELTSIATITSLTSLNLTYNELTEVPQAVANLGSLSELSLHGNPLASENPETFSGLVGRWKLDDGSGESADDVTSYEHDGTLKPTGELPTWVSGQSGNANDKSLYFDSTTEQRVIVSGVGVNSNPGEKNTVSFWMKWNGDTDEIPFAWLGTDYSLRFTDGFYGGTYFGFYTNEDNCLGVNASGWKNEWVHVSAVFYNGVASADTCRLYINGEQQSLVDLKDPTTTSKNITSSFCLSGCTDDASAQNRFGGCIDDVQIYNRELTGAEISTLAGKFMPSANLTALKGMPISLDIPAHRADEAKTISGLAAALNYNPIEIFEYIVNTIEFEPYAGAKKGALATWQTRAGNSWDTASLLAKLYEESGIDTEYALGGRIFLSADEVMDYVGATTLDGAGDILNAAGLNPSTPDAGIEFDHTWIRADLDTTGGVEWVELDPSMKFRDFGPDLDLPNMLEIEDLELTWESDGLIKEYLSESHTETAVEFYEGKVRDYLAENYPTISIADIAHDGPILVQYFDTLPEEMPYSNYTYASYNTVIPDERCYRIEIKCQNETDPWSVTTDKMLLPEIGLKQLSLRKMAGYGICLQLDGATIPGMRLNFYEQDYIDTWVNVYAGDGNNTLDQQLHFSSPAYQCVAISIGADQISDYLIQEKMGMLNDIAMGLQKADISAIESQRIWNCQYLDLVGLKYHHNMTQARSTIAELTHHKPKTSAISISCQRSDEETFNASDLGLTLPYIPVNTSFGSAISSWHAVSIDGDDTLSSQPLHLSGLTSSTCKVAVLEEMAYTLSASAVKSLQLANAHQEDPENPNWMIQFPDSGATIAAIENAIEYVLTLTDFNEDGYINHLDSADYEHNVALSIYNAIDAGYTVLVPKHLTYIKNQSEVWEGVGWIRHKSSSFGYSTLSGSHLDGSYVVGIPLPVEMIESYLSESQPGEDVNVASGAVLHDVTDVSIPNQGVPLEFSRHYQSNQTDKDFGMGKGWSYSYCDRLFDSHDPDDPDGTKIWYTGSGERYKFEKSGSSYVTPDGLYGNLVKIEYGTDNWDYLWTSTSGSTTRFDKYGRLKEMADRYGNGVGVNYDSSLSDPTINFDLFSPFKADNGYGDIETSSNTLTLDGDVWACLDLRDLNSGNCYEINENTVLEFDFRCEVPIERDYWQAIGFMDHLPGELQGEGSDWYLNVYSGGGAEGGLPADTPTLFHLYGQEIPDKPQSAYGTYSNYPYVQHYTIDVGQFYTGDAKYLVFGNYTAYECWTHECTFTNVRMGTKQIDRVYDLNAPSTRYLDFTYDLGLLQSVKDFNDDLDRRTWTYTYAYAYVNPRLSSAKTQDDNNNDIVISYNYYTDDIRNDLLKNVEDANGNKTEYTYYTNRRSFQVIDPGGNTETRSYDFFRNRASVIDSNGNTIVYTYDSEGYITEVLYPDRTTKETEWQNGLKTVEYDEYGQAVNYEYNDIGNLIRTVDQLDNEVVAVFEENNTNISRISRIEKNDILPILFNDAPYCDASADQASVIITYDTVYNTEELNYNVTPYTVIEFDFYSTGEGDEHSVVIADGAYTAETPKCRFHLYGSDPTGNHGDLNMLVVDDYYNYSSGVKHYAIPVGQYITTGPTTTVRFWNDDDNDQTDSNSRFSNVRLYEATPYASQEFIYNADGSLHESIDVLDNITAYTYPTNSRGLPETVTQPKGTIHQIRMTM